MSKRILIIHDRFQFRGGAERMVLDMAAMLGADICTEFWNEGDTFPKSEVPRGLFVLDEGEPPMMVLRYFRSQWNFWWKTRRLLRQYDTLIFSGNNCLAAAFRPLKGKRAVLYCHTPVRYVYDLLERRRAEEPSLLKRVVYYDIGKYFIRGMYQFGLSRMQTVIANSRNVRDRLWRYCKMPSRVIVPPINTDKFRWLGQGDYYLSWARLDGLKRVEDIVRAFQRMPDKKLVVASGGDREQAVRALAQGFANIEVLGWVEYAKLCELVGNCIATIYIPVDEDWGMSPVEGMSAGKPCIGVDEGGLRETVVPGQTGTLIPKEARVEDLVDAVRELAPERALSMRAACEAHAQQFSSARFEREIREAIGPDAL
jgi:glycosyltransferase involved in cell wall biosynthesis